MPLPWYSALSLTASLLAASGFCLLLLYRFDANGERSDPSGATPPLRQQSGASHPAASGVLRASGGAARSSGVAAAAAPAVTPVEVQELRAQVAALTSKVC